MQFDTVALKALAKKPEERYQNAHAFHEAMLGAFAAPVSPVVSEETIINELVRSSGHQEPSQPSNSSSPSPVSYPTPSQPSGSFPDSSQPHSRTVPPPGWEAAVLKQIEQQLARLVGPVAKVMVKRGAASTNDVDRLYRLLAENLSDPGERAAFLAGRQKLQGVPAREAGATTGSTVMEQASVTGLTVRLTAEAIEQATKRLAADLGPIAKTVAKKAATQATSRRHFHQLLAEKLTDPTERARFLHDLGAE
jgi:serine/threonine-protein kinase